MREKLPNNEEQALSALRVADHERVAKNPTAPAFEEAYDGVIAEYVEDCRQLLHNERDAGVRADAYFTLLTKMNNSIISLVRNTYKKEI